MTREISRLFPGCPPKGAQTITKHTARRGSGRVGRTAHPCRGRAHSPPLRQLRGASNDNEWIMSAAKPRVEIHDEVDRVLDRWRNPL
ncbi:MAG: hypothetical protein DMG40_02515 [Acidobacteria bacterium]|nr:MAG: hypothetical protein DMG40_02515 [Acidobacteriota bacterium]